MSDSSLVKPFGRPIEYTAERIVKLADGLIEFMEQENNFWLKDYAISLKIPAQVLSELAALSLPETDERAAAQRYFSEAYRLAKDVQEAKIAKNGLKGRFNAQMSKFALQNVAGWRESGSLDITSGGQALGYVALPDRKPIEALEIIDVEAQAT